ncbi:uncharacterized protein KD926_011451 [Aspergillus affinis]|uniref:uncharacterized protein n=1 Tax=Aspergillus affinis TaxID=1070780 RepID=UPI0022FF1439|nr:uncharacterized protein KD926_011451 [Aspergillus affinis]KAI9037928.1 hypothetical protein KD926_011451 [Aspergillus affinis]
MTPAPKNGSAQKSNPQGPQKRDEKSSLTSRWHPLFLQGPPPLQPNPKWETFPSPCRPSVLPLLLSPPIPRPFCPGVLAFCLVGSQLDPCALSGVLPLRIGFIPSPSHPPTPTPTDSKQQPARNPTEIPDSHYTPRSSSVISIPVGASLGRSRATLSRRLKWTARDLEDGQNLLCGLVAQQEAI